MLRLFGNPSKHQCTATLREADLLGMAIITLQSSRAFVVAINNQLLLVARRIAEAGRVELYCHTHRALPGFRGSLGSPAILSLRGRHTKWRADERVAIALLSPFRQLAQIAWDLTKKGSLGVERANLFSERDSHRLYSTEDFLRSVLNCRWAGFYLFQKGRLALNFADRLLQYIKVRRNLVITAFPGQTGL
jgi:hypothetical protein